MGDDGLPEPLPTIFAMAGIALLIACALALASPI